MVNLPRIGVNENVAFPAVQANVAPAVSQQEATGMISHAIHPSELLKIFLLL